MPAPFYDQGGAFGSSQQPDRLTEILSNHEQMSAFDRRFRYEIRLTPGAAKPHLEELLQYVDSHFKSSFLKFKERLADLRLEDIDFAPFAEVDALRQRVEFARELVLRRRTVIREWKSP